MRIKQPSHGKFKLVNSRWQPSKSWQTRSFKRQNSRQIMTNGHFHHDRLSAVALTHNTETEDRTEETEEGGEIESFTKNLVCSLAPPISFVCF